MRFLVIPRGIGRGATQTGHVRRDHFPDPGYRIYDEDWGALCAWSAWARLGDRFICDAGQVIAVSGQVHRAGDARSPFDVLLEVVRDFRNEHDINAPDPLAVNVFVDAVEDLARRPAPLVR